MNNELILQIVLSVMGLVSILVTGLLIPYLKTKIDKEKRDDVVEWVERSVKAAEQLFPELNTGQKKKAYVVKFLRDIGIKLSDEELNILIESAVKELNIWQTEIKKN